MAIHYVPKKFFPDAKVGSIVHIEGCGSIIFNKGQVIKSAEEERRADIVVRCSQNKIYLCWACKEYGFTPIPRNCEAKRTMPIVFDKVWAKGTRFCPEPMFSFRYIMTDDMMC